MKDPGRSRSLELVLD